MGEEFVKHILRYAVVAALLTSSTALFGQYPLPQANESAPQTTCPGCSPIRSSNATPPGPVTKTRAFGDPIAAFTGRFLDSCFAGDW